MHGLHRARRRDAPPCPRNVLEFPMKAKDPCTRSAVQFAPGWDPDAAKKRRGPLYGDICGFLSHIAVRRPELPDPPTSRQLVDLATTIVTEYETFLLEVTQGNATMLGEGAAVARKAIAQARAMEATLNVPLEHTP